MRCATALSAALALAFAGGCLAAEEHDKGESKEELALKHRKAAPKDAEIDASVTLGAMLEKKDKGAFSIDKGARVSGTLVQVETEEDGDIHMTLAPQGKETDTSHWVIVEVPQVWQKQDKSLQIAALKQHRGKQVTVTGWLYYEPDDDHGDPRGTMWELHPVTSIK